jgi:DNA polymerase-1
MYTILVGSPEPNLCRAYMPYNCVNEKQEVFDVYNKEHLRTWKGEWYLIEDPTKRWTKTDIHGVTTKIAFDIDETHPDFHALRYKGKRVNFAKNYGAKFRRIKQMFPEYDDERIKKIDDSYYLAFPGVKKYHEYCYQLALAQSYAVNLFGVRYYNVSGHNLINMLIQGSGAYFLKWKIKENYDYCKAHGIKSRLQMNIHDELSWEKHKDDPIEVFYKFKELMETWEDTLVPIVADMEITYSTWAKKEEI